MVIVSIFSRCSYGNGSFIIRVSYVYHTYILRIYYVIDSEKIGRMHEGHRCKFGYEKCGLHPQH